MASAPAPGEAPDAAPARPAVQWKTPEGWKEETAGGMRVARFTVPGKEGQDADVSIIPLPGVSASKRDIVNLWREQIRLDAIKDEDLSSQSEKAQIGPEPGELFDMVSSDLLIDNKFKRRILVGMLAQARRRGFSR